MQRNANVVVGIDFSETSELALDTAFAISAGGAGELHAVHVIPGLTLPIGSETGTAVATQQIEAHVDGMRERLKNYVTARVAHFEVGPKLGFERVVVHAQVGGAAECLAALAARIDADLVVVGTRGRRGVSRLLLGSVAELTTRLCRCPVLVVRPKQHETDSMRVPRIEPPCPRCVEARLESHGRRFWCDQHSHHHDQPHHYHYDDRTAAEVSMPLVMPLR